MNNILEHLGRGLRLIYEEDVADFDSSKDSFKIKLKTKVGMSIKTKLNKLGWIDTLTDDGELWEYPLY